jgi:hypothetical protein
MFAIIPDILELNKRRYAWRSRIERYKAELAGIPFQDRPDAPDVLVPIKKFAAELGVSVRTVERRIVEARKATGKSEASAIAA